MTDFAHFDLIVEIGLPAINEILYETPYSPGAAYSPYQKTFRPPFSDNQSVWIDPLELAKPEDQRKPPDFVFHFIVRNAGIVAVPGEPVFNLQLDFWKSSLTVGTTNKPLVYMIEGTAIIRGMFRHRMPTVSNPAQGITMGFGKIQWNGVDVHIVSYSGDDAAAVQVKDAMTSAIAAKINALTEIFIPFSIPFKIWPIPIIAWIGNSTLGIFYSDDPLVLQEGPQHAGLKQTSDLDGYSFAAVLAKSSFHDYLCQSLIRPKGRAYYREVTVSRIAQQMATNEGRSATTEDQKNAAAIVDAFMETQAGQDAITAYTPRPCGTGVISFTIHTDFPLPALDIELVFDIVTLDLQPSGWDTLILSSHVLLHMPWPYKDWSLDVSLPIHLSIDGYGQLKAVVLPADLDSVRKYIIARAKEYGWPLASYVPDEIPPDDMVKKLLPSSIDIGLPADIVLKEFRIRPDAILLLGDVRQSPAFVGDLYFPVAHITVTQTAEELKNAVEFPYEFAGTSYGCPAGEFQFTERFFDCTFDIGIDGKDVAFPIAATDWTVEFGSRVGFDPRPNFGSLGSGFPLALRAGAMEVDTHVSYRRPPFDGHGEMRKVRVNISETDDGGWRFTSIGEDGEYFVRVTATVTDASGQVFHPEPAIFLVSGERVLPGRDWEEAEESCRTKYRLSRLGRPPVVAFRPNRPGPVDVGDPFGGARVKPGDLIVRDQAGGLVTDIQVTPVVPGPRLK